MKYTELLPIYAELYSKFIEETGQHSEEAGHENMLVQLNIRDLEMNRKPEGYNRDLKTPTGHVKLVWPITTGKLEFYIRSTAESTEIPRITKSLSEFLESKGFKNDISWDQLLAFRSSNLK